MIMINSVKQRNIIYFSEYTVKNYLEMSNTVKFCTVILICLEEHCVLFLIEIHSPNFMPLFIF